MKNAAFQPFVTTVGADGTIMMPLSDADSAGIPILTVGPGYSRNGVRYFVKMPSKDDAERHLPAPIGYDRRSVTFEPRALVVTAPLPAHCTVAFIRLRNGSDRGKITKKPAHLWSPLDDTALYPAAKIEVPPLAPGDTFDLEGTSYWFNDRNYDKRQSKSPLHIPHPPQDPPQVKTLMPTSLQLLIRLHWLPSQPRKSAFSFVSGSPIGKNVEAAPATPVPTHEFEEGKGGDD